MCLVLTIINCHQKTWFVLCGMVHLRDIDKGPICSTLLKCSKTKSLHGLDLNW